MRRHDGFYLRFGIGAGRGAVNSTGTLSPSPLIGGDFEFDVDYSGFGPAYELLIGGTPGGGVVVGGGFIGQDIQDPDVESELLLLDDGVVEANGALGLVVVGPFIDWFPDETGGLHVGAMLGIGGIGLEDGRGDTSSGWGASLWSGYDFWVSQQWALGAELRAVYLSTSREFDDNLLNGSLEDRGTSLELLFTALYH